MWDMASLEASLRVAGNLFMLKFTELKQSLYTHTPDTYDWVFLIQIRFGCGLW